MGRRSLGLALASLALVVPASAHAAPKAQEADPYKVLVVTSTADALSAAGVNAITRPWAPTASSRAAPGCGRRGVHPAGLDTYRAVVFLNTGQASPLTDAQRTNFEAYFKQGRRLRRHRFRRRDRRELDVPDQHARHALVGPGPASQSGTVKVFDRVHDATQEPAGVLGPHRRIGTTSRRTSAASSHVLATVVEDPFGPQPAGQHARRHRRRHDGRQPPDLLLQGLPGRALVLHRPRQHVRGASTRA